MLISVNNKSMNFEISESSFLSYIKNNNILLNNLNNLDKRLFFWNIWSSKNEVTLKDYSINNEYILSINTQKPLISLWYILNKSCNSNNYSEYIKEYEYFMQKNIRKFLGFSKTNKLLINAIINSNLFEFQHKWITILWKKLWICSDTYLNILDVQIVDGWQSSAIILILFKILLKLSNNIDLCTEEKEWISYFYKDNIDWNKKIVKNMITEWLMKIINIKFLIFANEEFEREIIFWANNQNDTSKFLEKY